LENVQITTSTQHQGTLGGPTCVDPTLICLDVVHLLCTYHLHLKFEYLISKVMKHIDYKWSFSKINLITSKMMQPMQIDNSGDKSKRYLFPKKSLDQLFIMRLERAMATPYPPRKIKPQNGRPSCI
jgi:hypothetical protein